MNADLILYSNPMSRGRIARWMLEDLGRTYRVEYLEYATMKASDYLAVNPMGKVPALRHGDAVVTECAAICCLSRRQLSGSRLATRPRHAG